MGVIRLYHMLGRKFSSTWTSQVVWHLIIGSGCGLMVTSRLGLYLLVHQV